MPSIVSRVFWLLSGYWIVWRYRLKAKGRLRVVGFPVVKNNGEIILGAEVDLRSTPGASAMGVITPVILNTMTADSIIRVGDFVGMSGVVICCKKKITIGDRVRFGSGVVISDTDFHSLDYEVRASPEDASSAATSPVYIGDDCFVGARAIILKGVTVGARSIVGAGSVVVKDVPADTVVAGNPAREIRSLA